MDYVEELMSVLEGVCLNCGGQLETTEIGGTRKWLQNDCFYPTEGVEVNEWNGSDGHTVGCLIQKCADCGQQFETYANRFGDWSM